VACQSHCLSSRMYNVTLTDHALSLLFTRHQVFSVSWVTFFNGLCPAFDLTSLVIYSNHKGLKWWWLTQLTGNVSLCMGTPLHREIDETHPPTLTLQCENATHRKSDFWLNWIQTQMSIGPQTHVEPLAVGIEMLAWHHLSQQHITSTLLTFTQWFFDYFLGVFLLDMNIHNCYFFIL